MKQHIAPRLSDHDRTRNTIVAACAAVSGVLGYGIARGLARATEYAEQVEEEADGEAGGGAGDGTGATCERTCSTSSSAVACAPGASTTYALISSPSSGWGTPTTAASATAGCS